MKLRYRLALSFAAFTSSMLIASRAVTIVSFQHAQQVALDGSLLERARREAEEVKSLGRPALYLQYEAVDDTDPLEQLVTYGALYRRDGKLVADTPSFASAPALRDLGVEANAKRSGRCFDFRYQGKVLRGVLQEVAMPGPDERLYLLVAASRRDMDADARELIDLGLWVTVTACLFSMILGGWLGGRMTAGLEQVAAVARRVGEGDLDAPIAVRGPLDDEVQALAGVLHTTVERLKAMLSNERRFASHAAHELRSPLTALRGELELALRRRRTSEQYETALREALDDTNRLVTLSEDLLVVARGGGERRDSNFTLRDLVDEAVRASLARRPGDKGENNSENNSESSSVDVPLRTEVDEGEVVGDRNALVRMLRNLVDNAVAHAPPGTPVTVRARFADSMVRIDVEDEGPGVPPSFRDRIFEPFVRADDDRARSGAGLGLGIARETARQHGGEVTLDAEAPVTRFVIEFRRGQPERTSLPS